MKMNSYMKVAAQIYGDGDYRHLAGKSEITMSDLDVGDTLFRFIMIELSSEEDCTDLGTAISRMRTAKEEIDMVIHAMEGLIG